MNEPCSSWSLHCRYYFEQELCAALSIEHPPTFLPSIEQAKQERRLATTTGSGLLQHHSLLNIVKCLGSHWSLAWWITIVARRAEVALSLPEDSITCVRSSMQGCGCFEAELLGETANTGVV